MSRPGYLLRALLLAITLTALAVAQNPTSTPAKAKPAKATVPAKVKNDVQVERIDTSDAELPADFRVAIYENMISELAKSGQFANVYRAGDERAKSSSNLVTLTASAKKFSRGNETTRAVTTVGGATKLTVHVKLADKDGKALVDKDVDASVRFFGENLKATQGLAKHIVELLKTI